MKILLDIRVTVTFQRTFQPSAGLSYWKIGTRQMCMKWLPIIRHVNSVEQCRTVSTVSNSVNSVNSYSAVLPPSPMVFYIYYSYLLLLQCAPTIRELCQAAGARLDHLARYPEHSRGEVLVSGIGHLHFCFCYWCTWSINRSRLPILSTIRGCFEDATSRRSKLAENKNWSIKSNNCFFSICV